MASTSSSLLTTDLPQSEPQVPLTHKDAKFIVFSDWDGTITELDSNDYLTDKYGLQLERRRKLNEDIRDGKKYFRDGFREMVESVASNDKMSFDGYKKELEEKIVIDEGFPAFNKWCNDQSIPVVIVSSGMAPLIRAVLFKRIADDEVASKIEIISNDVQINEDGIPWEIKYRHPESIYGHDKSRAILPYRFINPRPTIFFFGDGVSDMSAAEHADVLFVKMKTNGETDLATYCINNNIKFIEFTQFSQAQAIVKSIVDGMTRVDDPLTVEGVLEQYASKHQIRSQG